MKILAIETSCDETAASIVKSSDNKIAILSNVIASQIDIHQKFGGVYPEIASRAHTEQIIAVITASLRQTADSLQQNSKKPLAVSREPLANIDLIAVTSGPGLIGSLLVGVNAAKTLAFADNKPIIGINHWLGHIYSCFSDNENLPQFPLLALIVSGGHTGLVLMKSHTEIETIGQTLDDAAGEAFDKVAKLLDLGYPGGPAISKIAIDGNAKRFDFPRSMLNRENFDFSFSGLKTAVLYESKKHKLDDKTKSDFAASFQQCVIDILIGKTLKAAEKYQPKSILLCGGVSANKELREQMKIAIDNFNAVNLSAIHYHLPPLSLTGDNAAMIGIAAAYQIANGIRPTTFDQIDVNSNLKLK